MVKKSIGIVISIGLVVAFFVALEMVASGHLKADRLDQILSVLQRDTKLLWIQRPNLDTLFFGARIRTDATGLRLNPSQSRESPGGRTFTILTLGASPSFGWGVADDETYSARLEALLNRERGDSSLNFRVVNGSVIGFSSTQGLELLNARLASLNPDLILVAYVINDVDSYRFFYNDGSTDTAVAQPPAWTIPVANKLSRFAFVRMMERALTGTLLPKPHLSVAACETLAKPRSPRVSLETYRENLTRFAQWGLENGKQVVFLKMPVNLPKGPMERDEELEAQLTAKGRSFAENGQCAEAISVLTEAHAANPLAKLPVCLLSYCLDTQGDGKNAAQQFAGIQRIDAHLAAERAERYNSAMCEVARQNNIDCLDIVALFNKEKDQFLFIDRVTDTIHPNKTGHEMIAEEVKTYIINSLWPNHAAKP